MAENAERELEQSKQCDLDNQKTVEKVDEKEVIERLDGIINVLKGIEDVDNIISDEIADKVDKLLNVLKNIKCKQNAAVLKKYIDNPDEAASRIKKYDQEAEEEFDAVLKVLREKDIDLERVYQRFFSDEKETMDDNTQNVIVSTKSETEDWIEYILGPVSQDMGNTLIQMMIFDSHLITIGKLLEPYLETNTIMDAYEQKTIKRNCILKLDYKDLVESTVKRTGKDGIVNKLFDKLSVIDDFRMMFFTVIVYNVPIPYDIFPFAAFALYIQYLVEIEKLEKIKEDMKNERENAKIECHKENRKYVEKREDDEELSDRETGWCWVEDVKKILPDNKKKFRLLEEPKLLKLHFSFLKFLDENRNEINYGVNLYLYNRYFPLVDILWLYDLVSLQCTSKKEFEDNYAGIACLTRMEPFFTKQFLISKAMIDKVFRMRLFGMQHDDRHRDYDSKRALRKTEIEKNRKNIKYGDTKYRENVIDFFNVLCESISYHFLNDISDKAIREIDWKNTTESEYTKRKKEREIRSAAIKEEYKTIAKGFRQWGERSEKLSKEELAYEELIQKLSIYSDIEDIIADVADYSIQKENRKQETNDQHNKQKEKQKHKTNNQHDKKDAEIFRAVYQAVRAQKNSGNRM